MAYIFAFLYCSPGSPNKNNGVVCHSLLQWTTFCQNSPGIYSCFTDYVKAFDLVDHNKLWKILKEVGIPYHLTCLLRNLYVGQEAALRTLHGTMDWFQIGKEYDKGIYCHPVYLTSMQSTSWEMLDWMSYELESGLLGEISTTSDMQMISF